MNPTRLLISLLAMPACGGQGGDSGEATPDLPEGPTGPYLEEGADPGLPSFDAETVEAVIAEAIEAARWINAVPVILGYAEHVVENMDENCPNWGSFEATPYWYGTCTSSTGTTFEGSGFLIAEENLDDGSGVTWEGYYSLYSVADVIDAVGTTFSGSGSAAAFWGTYADGTRAHYSYLEEGFAYDGPSADGTWLAAGISPSFAFWALEYPHLNNGRIALVAGSIAVDNADPDTSQTGIEHIVFEEILIGDESLGASCPLEPTGMVSILDGEGGWYDLVFDGAPFEDGFFGAPMAPERCDGCADAWHKGEYLGEACVDFSPLLSWEGLAFEW